MLATVRKLGGGGDKDVEAMLENAASLGIDVIELLWLTKTGGPRWSIAQIVGYKFPVIGKPNGNSVDIQASQWVDGTLKFYPDNNGRCWGYVYDTEENRNLIYRSLANGWFRVVDKKLRDQIEAEAHERGIGTTILPKNQVNVKKSIAEVEATKKTQELEARLAEMQRKMEETQKQLEIANNERMVRLDKRAKGSPIPIDLSISDKILEGKK